jgi:adenosine deaminase/adenosine deaminase CECR1
LATYGNVQVLQQCFPEVKYTLHAGELTLGLVQPEDLTCTLTMLYIAGANRIGHGVDMDEKMLIPLLKHMAKKIYPSKLILLVTVYIKG